MMDLQAMARDISTKLEAAGFPRSEAATRQVFNLAEEVGEFVGAYRRWKGMARRKGTFEDVASELADVVITAYVTAFELKVHLDEEIAAKLEVIYSRGWHEGGKQTEQARPRRVWGAFADEPPVGVNVLHDAAADDGEESYLCRLPSGEWEWFHSPDPRKWTGLRKSSAWAMALSEATGPLTEVVEGGDV